MKHIETLSLVLCIMLACPAWALPPTVVPAQSSEDAKFISDIESALAPSIASCSSGTMTASQSTNPCASGLTPCWCDHPEHRNHTPPRGLVGCYNPAYAVCIPSIFPFHAVIKAIVSDCSNASEGDYCRIPNYDVECGSSDWEGRIGYCYNTNEAGLKCFPCWKTVDVYYAEGPVRPAPPKPSPAPGRCKEWKATRLGFVPGCQHSQVIDGPYLVKEVYPAWASPDAPPCSQYAQINGIWETVPYSCNDCESNSKVKSYCIPATGTVSPTPTYPASDSGSRPTAPPQDQ